MTKTDCIHVTSDIVKITFTGDMVYGQTGFLQEYNLIINDDITGYIFNLTHVKRIDSTGFGAIVSLASKLKGKKICLVVSDELVKRMIQITKLHLVFFLADTVEQALVLLQSSEDNSLLPIDQY
ncbi:anti-sigma factor antagonist [Bacillus sp. HMF5848]|uniref:STAS domain-containing protein n=1 Tax=Bacillus sp. HMF5848 TaxID=2495421 RepID=UPI000F795F49|nr:STAS domain-containing protein [Bacillus sp. HMF5848]RSK26208.1 anti-sigma factor antagonist [Bacillus sp. HMF5848]